MALPAPLQALFDRLQTYNSDPYNSTSNPGGFARGGNQKPVDNFIKSIRDLTAFGRGISLDAKGSAEAAAQSVGVSAANVELTAEDAENTRLDRIATAENVVLAANEVTKAGAQAEALIGTSNSVNAPGAGNRVFQTQPGKQFRAGGFVSIVNPNVLRWMFGRVNSYNAATGVLAVEVEDFGPLTEAVQPWTIQVSGARGARGPTGPFDVASIYATNLHFGS